MCFSLSISRVKLSSLLPIFFSDLLSTRLLMKRKESVLQPEEEVQPTSSAGNPDVEINDDDICPVCQLLLYRPVRTRCNHTLCESCMAHWADVSITTQMTTVGLDDRAVLLLPSEIETKCPMCRTLTTANLDREREAKLQEQYPTVYQERQIEHQTTVDDDSASRLETLTVYIGNEYSMVRPPPGNPTNRHMWNFFVRPSRSDLLEEVQIFLVCLTIS